MVAHDEQIGQRTGHQQAMRVLLQTAIAHLGKAEHPLDDPDHMFNPGPHFGLGAVFRPLDLIDNTAVAVAAIGEIPGLGRALPDYRPLAAVSLITPYPGLLAVQRPCHGNANEHALRACHSARVMLLRQQRATRQQLWLGRSAVWIAK